MVQNKIAIVTGASSGIGKEAALLLAKDGYYVFAVARRLERLEEIRSENIEPYQLDVTDENGIKDFVNYVIKSKGRIDLLVNSAGFALLGALECVSMADAHFQFEVNVFGYARFMQNVLPHMRVQKSGHIINVTSAVGKVAIPAFGWYAASKHALEALSDAVRFEVGQFGIKVTIIEPGVIDTEFLDLQMERLNDTPHPLEYQNVANSVKNMLGEGKGVHPRVIGKAILKAAKAKNPPQRHALPLDAKLAIAVRRFAGDGIYNTIIKIKAKL